MALSIGRKPGQGVRIGNDIYVEVVEIRGDNVRLAITAPSHISILREEIVGRYDGHAVTVPDEGGEEGGCR